MIMVVPVKVLASENLDNTSTIESCNVLPEEIMNSNSGIVEYMGFSYFINPTNKNVESGWIDYNGNNYYADLKTKRLYNLVHEVDG